ncbi:MAG: Fur family transcriptional regulator, partial [Geminicoccales bacterium]
IGMIARAHHQGSSARFDAKTHRHHHLVCTSCRRTIDYESPEFNELPLPEPPSGFRVTDYSIQFMGLCPACRAAANNPEDEPGP